MTLYSFLEGIAERSEHLGVVASCEMDVLPRLPMTGSAGVHESSALQKKEVTTLKTGKA